MNFEEAQQQNNKEDGQRKFMENLPNISFSHRPPNWADIYKGLLSPNAKEYKNYLRPVIKKL